MSQCDTCAYNEYDEEYEYYVCTKNLDEDEMYRFIKGEFRDCPYYQFGDEYSIVRKQKAYISRGGFEMVYGSAGVEDGVLRPYEARIWKKI